MPFVERGYLAAALQSRCPDYQVIEANHFPGDLQFGPDTGMLVCSLLGVGDDRQRVCRSKAPGLGTAELNSMRCRLRPNSLRCPSESRVLPSFPFLVAA